MNNPVAFICVICIITVLLCVFFFSGWVFLLKAIGFLILAILVTAIALAVSGNLKP